MNTPKLMVDSSDKDGKAEIMMDYVLSWALRWADASLSSEKPLLHQKCKFILCKFLQVPCSEIDQVSFTDINVWKEHENIDLWVELKATNDGTTKNCALLIENKYYTGLHNAIDEDGESRNQLEVYKKKFERYYANQSDKWELSYAVYTCLEPTHPKYSMFDIAKKYGFKVLSFYDVLPDYELTESDIYNEFWINW